MLIVAAMTVAGLSLFPPWRVTFQLRGLSRVERPAGYHFLLRPPQLSRTQSAVTLDSFKDQTDPAVFPASPLTGVSVDTRLLLLEYVGCTLLFGALFLALAPGRRINPNPRARTLNRVPVDSPSINPSEAPNIADEKPPTGSGAPYLREALAGGTLSRSGARGGGEVYPWPYKNTARLMGAIGLAVGGILVFLAFHYWPDVYLGSDRFSYRIFPPRYIGIGPIVLVAIRFVWRDTYDKKPGLIVFHWGLITLLIGLIMVVVAGVLRLLR